MFEQFNIQQTVPQAVAPSYSGQCQLSTRQSCLPAAAVDPVEVPRARPVAPSNMGTAAPTRLPRSSPVSSVTLPEMGTVLSEQQTGSGSVPAVTSSTSRNGLGSAGQPGTNDILPTLDVLAADSQVTDTIIVPREEHTQPASTHPLPSPTSPVPAASPSAASTTASVNDASSQVLPRPRVPAKSKYARRTEALHQYLEDILNEPRKYPRVAENENRLLKALLDESENTPVSSGSSPSAAQLVTSECASGEKEDPPHPLVIMPIEEQEECQEPTVPAAEPISHLLPMSVAAKQEAPEEKSQVLSVPPADGAFQLGTVENPLCVSPCTCLFCSIMCFHPLYLSQVDQTVNLF